MLRVYAAVMATWTPEQARQNARKGAQIRWARVRARANALANASGNGTPCPDGVAATTFTTELLAGVRAQARSVLVVLEQELTRARGIDGGQVDRLASALERLADLERVLDNRPLPGSRRPGRDEARRPPPPARPVQPILPQPLQPIGADEDTEDPPIVYAPEL